MGASQKPETDTRHTRASLIQGLQSGDEDRWREFYRLYGPVLRGFALKAGLTETEADEVAQETCIGVARNIGRFHYDPRVCRFKSWLLNLASWRVKNQFEKRRRWDDRVHSKATSYSPERPGSDTVEQADNERTATIERVADPSADSPDIIWDREWRSNLLQAALERIRRSVSATQFQIFDLAAVKEWPAPQVARSLGVSLGKVYLTKHRLSVALKKELKRLEKQMEHGQA